jgi:bifunctional non-homologous end joining protein LigD
VLYLFHLLYLDGLDLRRVTLIERKQVLAELPAPLDEDGAVRLSEHLEIDSAEMRARACAMGFEGIVSQRKDGRYESGRTSLWTKSPCKVRETFAIAGLALKGTKLDGFYLAEERGRKLVYACKIEGGWSEEEKNDLLARIKPHKRCTPAIELSAEKPKAHWVEPRVLVDVEYRARMGTSDLLRHPRYKGIREDLSD